MTKNTQPNAPERIRRYFGRVFTRPGRPGYYVRVRHKGHQRVRYGGESRRVVHERIAKVQAALSRGLGLDAAMEEGFGHPKAAPEPAVPAVVRPTFAETAERYLQSVEREKRESTLAEDRVRMDVILEAPWVRKPLDAIGKGEIAAWVDGLNASRNRGKGLAPSTLNRYRSLISVVFEYAVERDLLETNPARGLKRADESHRARETFLTAQEIRALLRHAPAELRLMVLTAATTGLRQGAIRELRWTDVDLEAGTLVAKASYAKGKKPQLFLLTPEVVEGLKEIRRELKVRSIEGADKLFRTSTGRPWSRGWLCVLMRRAVDACSEIPLEKRKQVTFHTLRHSFATLLMLSGMNARKLQEALAHSDPSLTSRYSHLGSETMVEVQRRIAQILNPGQPEQVREGYRRDTKAAFGA